jgi:hypothetical protein
VKRAGAPASSVTMWAESVQTTASHGCRTDASPTTLAPVPPQHMTTSTGASKAARRSATAASVQASAP